MRCQWIGYWLPLLVAASWYVKESVRQSGAVVTQPVSISSYPLRLRHVTKPKRLGVLKLTKPSLSCKVTPGLESSACYLPMEHHHALVIPALPAPTECHHKTVRI